MRTDTHIYKTTLGCKKSRPGVGQEGQIVKIDLTALRYKDTEDSWSIIPSKIVQ